MTGGHKWVYSPECVEGRFSELRPEGALRSSRWSLRGEGPAATPAFDDGLPVPPDPPGPLPVHQVARVGVHPQGGIGDNRRAPLLFLARQHGVLLAPQDQRRRADLAEAGPIVGREHTLIVVAPDAGRDLEAPGDRPL